MGWRTRRPEAVPPGAASAHPLHDQIDDGQQDADADQARRSDAVCEFRDVVGHGSDEHAGVIAEDQIDQDDRKDDQKPELDEEPEKAPRFLEEVQHGLPPTSSGGEASSPPELDL